MDTIFNAIVELAKEGYTSESIAIRLSYAMDILNYTDGNDKDAMAKVYSAMIGYTPAMA